MTLCTLGLSAQDYSVKVGPTKGVEADGKAKCVANCTFGTDVVKYYYASYSGKRTASQVETLVTGTLSKKTSTDLKTKAEGKNALSVTYSSSESKISTFIIAIFDADDKYTGNYAYCYLTYSLEKDWKDAGTVQYTDGFMGNFNKTVDGLTWPVKIQSIDAIPDYYRLVTPYGEDCTLVKKYSNFTADGTTQYMYIDATDPDKVFIENYHTTGMKITSDTGEGPLYLSSKAGYDISKGNVIDVSKYGMFDKTKGTITFPTNVLYYCWSKDGKISWTASNKNGAFKIAFPVSANMTITGAKWGTFFAPFDVTLPEGAFAYTVTVEDNKTVRNKVAEGDDVENNVVPANTAVLVYSSTAINEDYEGYATDVMPVGDNALVGTLEPIASGDAPVDAYFLAKKNDVLNFYPAGAAKLAANRAYLVVSSNVKIDGLFEGEVTGINEVNAKNADSILRNIQGMPVNKGYKGIVIMDGKKYLKK